jgi:hypothetical protein
MIRMLFRGERRQRRRRKAEEEKQRRRLLLACSLDMFSLDRRNSARGQEQQTRSSWGRPEHSAIPCGVLGGTILAPNHRALDEISGRAFPRPGFPSRAGWGSSVGLFQSCPLIIRRGKHFSSPPHSTHLITQQLT